MDLRADNHNVQQTLIVDPQQLELEVNVGPRVLPTVSGKRDRFMGFVALGLCIAAYTLQSVILKSISNQPEETFGPFLTLWLSHSTLMLLIPVSFVQLRSNRSAGPHTRQRKRQPWTTYVSQIKLLSGRGWTSFLKISFSLALLYTFPNYLWYVALRLSSISEATTIFSTNCVFAYLLSAWFNGTKLKMISIVALILSIIGAATISMETTTTISLDNVRFLGNLLTLISAITYGLYEVLYEKYAAGQHSSPFLANQFTGWIGVFTFTTQWILIPVLHMLNVEQFKIMNSQSAWKLLFLNSLLSFAYNSLFMFSLASVGPVVSSVGLMLAIPASWLAEYIMDINFRLSFLSVCGSCLIIGGFMLLVKNEISKPFVDSNCDDDDE